MIGTLLDRLWRCLAQKGLARPLSSFAKRMHTAAVPATQKAADELIATVDDVSRTATNTVTALTEKMAESTQSITDKVAETAESVGGAIADATMPVADMANELSGRSRQLAQRFIRRFTTTNQPRE
ncbi:hypothetical protein [Nocardia terpenica]|uniref:Uncharacterized protein n=1 Tax=Nocardia terpenica TaxID=455432 RepID=A0A6G9ZCR8_9NOCA|nr:hypothetical protein [Nocardia terpenica]QIS23405.1 hypothetical protein F6W96_38820 [Nocardia terpenica]